MHERLKIALAVIVPLAVGAMGVALFRYEYIPQPQRNVASHLLRIDRLTGKTCFIPLHQTAEYLSRMGYIYGQCDAQDSQDLAIDPVRDKVEGESQLDDLLRDLEETAKQAEKEK